MKKVPRITTLHRRLLHWYSHHQRDLPWRRTRDPYAILISEVMLQQTQVDRVIPKYQAWLKAFPNFSDLSRAPLRRVLKLWSGLGYNSRALRLRAMARIVVRQYGGTLPSDRERLEALPGIGQYTAGAVITFAFKKSVGVVDTNVRRVIGRVFFGVRGPKSEKILRAKVDEVGPTKNPDLWNHALMDLGATVCVSRRPKCEICPLQAMCRAYPAILRQPFNATIKKQPRFADSDRFWRGRIVKMLIEHHSVTRSELLIKLKVFGRIEATRMTRIIKELRRSGLIKQESSHLRLPA